MNKTILFLIITLISTSTACTESIPSEESQNQDTNANNQCIQDSDCIWIDTIPQEYGDCGCYLEGSINLPDLSTYTGPITECEPPPNIEKPCICELDQCKLNAL